MKLGKKISLKNFIKWSGSESMADIQAKNIKDTAIGSVSTDSRTLQPGDFFIPLKGPNFNGHDFINDAIAKGCCGFVLEKENAGIYRILYKEPGHSATGRLIVLKANDNLEFLMGLARQYLRSFQVKTIGITGSVGKTSTKNFIVNILSGIFKIKYTPRNYNTEVGISLTALEIDPSTRFFVAEMGMRGKGQIKKLAETIDPDIGVITSVGPSHLEFFKNIEEIALAKAELADFLSIKGGILFLNHDDQWTDFISQRTGAKIFLFGRNNHLDFNFIEYKVDDLGKYSFSFFQKDKKIADINLPFSGYHNLYNAGFAAAVCNYLGAGGADVKKGIELTAAADNRMDIFKNGDMLIINDCYNANPVSMKSAIRTLKLVSGKNASRSVALLADMLELGESAEKLHFEIGEYLGEKEIDVLIAFGKLSENICHGFALKNSKSYHFEDMEDLKKNLSKIIKYNDTVLVKGSRANKLETLLNIINKISKKNSK